MMLYIRYNQARLPWPGKTPDFESLIAKLKLRFRNKAIPIENKSVPIYYRSMPNFMARESSLILRRRSEFT